MPSTTDPAPPFPLAGIPALGERLTGWIERWRVLLEPLSDLVLALAVVLLWTRENMEVSGAVGTVWLLLRLAIGPGGGIRNWMLILMVLLNLRGVALQEGPKPVGPLDYITIILAFVAGLGRSLRQWRFTLISLATANLLGVVLNLQPLRRALFAILSGSADRRGWQGQTWGGQYFRAADMSVNQTALLCGLALCLALAMAWRSRGALRILMGTTALVCGTAAFATGSRLALLLPPVLVAVGLVVAERPGIHAWTPPWRWRWPRRRLILIALGLVGLVLLLHLGLGERLLQLYASRKSSGDDLRRQVVLCYAQIPFQWPWYWLIGAGYDQPRRRFCDEDVGITVTHAHNVFAQIMGESGLVAAGAVAVTAAVLTIRLWGLRPILWGEGSERRIATTTAPALIAGSLYLFVFQLFELGMMKVSLLAMVFGFLPSCTMAAKEPHPHVIPHVGAGNLNAEKGGSLPHVPPCT